MFSFFTWISCIVVQLLTLDILLHIIADFTVISFVQGGLDPDVHLKNLNLFYQDEKLKGDLVTRKKLENLDPASFSSILILADESATGNFIADADSRNLATLLLLRDIMVKSNEAQQLGSTDAVKPYSAYVTEVGNASHWTGLFIHI